MKRLTISVEIESINIANNGNIMCAVAITYNKNKRAVHVFDVTHEIIEWSK